MQNKTKQSSKISKNLKFLVVSLVFLLFIISIMTLFNNNLLFQSTQYNNSNNIGAEFSLMSIDGENINSEKLKTKPTILWFMATWCPSCLSQAYDLNQLHKQFGDEINIVAISLWTPSIIQKISDENKLDIKQLPDPDTVDQLQKFKDKFGGDWLWVMDNGEVTMNYNILTVDSTVILNKDWVIIYENYGPTGYEELYDVIDSEVN